MGLAIFLICFFCLVFLAYIHNPAQKTEAATKPEPNSPPSIKTSPPIGIPGYTCGQPQRVVVEDTETGARCIYESMANDKPIRIDGRTIYMEDGRIIRLQGRPVLLRTRSNYTDTGFYEIDIELLGRAYESGCFDYWHICNQRICSKAFVYTHSIYDPSTGRSWTGKEVAKLLGARYPY